MPDLIDRSEAKDAIFAKFTEAQLWDARQIRNRVSAALDALPAAGAEGRPPALLVGGKWAINGEPQWWFRYRTFWRQLNGAQAESRFIPRDWIDRDASDAGGE